MLILISRKARAKPQRDSSFLSRFKEGGGGGGGGDLHQKFTTSLGLLHSSSGFLGVGSEGRAFACKEFLSYIWNLHENSKNWRLTRL